MNNNEVVIPRSNPNWRDFSQALEDHGICFEYDIRGNALIAFWSELDAFRLSQSHNLMPNGGYRVNDQIENYIRLEFGRLTIKEWTNREGEIQRANFVISRERWQDFLHAYLIDKNVDYFKRWLESLKWDGVKRLECMLVDVFDEVEIRGNLTEKQRILLCRWASQATMLGAVWRTYQLGYKLDTMPVFIGGQGFGKSTLYRVSFPDAWQRYWFRDNINLGMDKKRWVEELGGGVICEVAEMAGMAGKEKELKAALTSLYDVVRLAYGRHAIDKPRQYVLVGTANETEDGELPEDSSGLRRFLPIFVKGHPDKVNAVMEENRDQYWAEAKALFDDGEDAYMPFELEQIAQKTHDDIALKGIKPFGRKVIEACYKGDLESERRYTLQEIAEVVGAVKVMQPPPRDDRVAEQEYNEETQYELVNRTDALVYGKQLRLLKWNRQECRRGGIKGYYWSFDSDNEYCD